MIINNFIIPKTILNMTKQINPINRHIYGISIIVVLKKKTNLNIGVN